jgi:hypothetical protein|tara:strand:+ start:75 stop:647 length:573 start_codon:yes stop_codon:yes gene_type:complete
MRDDLFSVPVRKYHIDEHNIFVQYVDEFYKKERFEVPSPYISGVSQLPPWAVPVYTEVLEQLLVDLKLFDSHVAIITSITLKVLEKGESVDRTHTLPSHYTLTHYINDAKQSDTFYHPLKNVIEWLNPGLDEWKEAAGMYINQGDVLIHPSFIEHSSPVMDRKRMTITLTVCLERNEQGRESSTEKSSPQ